MKDEKTILLAHGGGGELTHELLREIIIPRLENPILNPLMDSAVLDRPGGRICMTTDSYVVQPLEFPGGDIGRLSVCGTVNDLAVMGAKPIGLSLALIIEEGLKIDVLERILDSIAATANETGIHIVTGDTKVIERKSGDGLMITTAGTGVLQDGLDLSVSNIKEGDALIVNGPIAEHGLAVMSVREDLSFNTMIKSDVAPLARMIGKVLDSGAEVRFIRDLTRSGLAGVLVDICEGTGKSVEIEEADIPLTAAARHTAELLGLDPLVVANEGKCLIAVSENDVDKVLTACKSDKYGKMSRCIGRVTSAEPALVELKTRAGGRRIVQRPYGEELPRIC